MNRKKVVVSLMALSFVASVFAFGGDETEVKGMITARTGETLIVKSGAGTTTVVLTDNTRTKDDRGLFGLDKQEMSSVVLIPGLKVDIDGVSDDQGRVVAKTITVDGDDLETAEMIQSGLHPTAEQVAANIQALEAHSGQLESHNVQLAGQKENIIEVTGYADSPGSAAMNTNLSENRAKAVITYLIQKGEVPVRHIVAPGAMGEYGAAAPNETEAGRAENRRVDVKVLVNKGINGI